MGWGPSAPRPDPAIGQAARENAEIGRRYATLAEQEAARQQELTDEFAPMFREMIEQSITDANTSRERGDAQWESYSENFAPLEAQLARTAAEFDTPARREQAAREASTAVGDQFAGARDEMQQGLFSAGVQPGSGRSLALTNASRIEEAKAKAGAGNQARRDVETQGLALVDNAARFGRNMPSTGIATAALAGQQTGQAQGQVGGLQSLVSAPTQSMYQGLNGAIGANNAAGQLLLGDFNARMQGFNSQMGMLGDLIGAGATAYGMRSSEKAKDMGGLVDGRAASEAVERSPAKQWRYKPGEGDGSTQDRMGPTAEGLQEVAPSVSDGEMVDIPSMLGLHHASIGDQAKRIKRIESKLGLADAAQDIDYKEVA